MVSLHGVEQSVFIAEIERREKSLHNLGFTPLWVRKQKKSRTSLWCRNEEIINHLRCKGFADPIKLITKAPTVFGLSLKNIDEKIEGLRKLGFTDPIKLITRFPLTFGLSIKNIDEKIEGLRKLGFTDPIKLITRAPNVFGFSLKNIDAKIEVFRELGFTDSIRLIAKFPTVFGLSIDYINRKIALFRRYGLSKVGVVKICTTYLCILGVKHEKLEIILMLLCDKEKVGQACVVIKLDLFLAGMILWPDAIVSGEATVGQMKKLIQRVGLTKEKARELILKQHDDLPCQIATIYLRGYPLK